MPFVVERNSYSGCLGGFDLKLLRQILIILVIFYVGQAIQLTTHIPIPGSVIGMILLFLLLSFHVISIDLLKELSDFCLSNLAFFFVPIIVSVVTAKDKILHIAPQFLATVVLSTAFVMVATGLAAQFLLRRREAKSNERL